MARSRHTPSLCGPLSAAPQAWSSRSRRVVSLLLALHLAAVFAAPWSGPPPSSLLAQTVAGWISPYLQAAYLNHGYRFFAPNPGPSHLVRYEAELPDGRIVTGRFPEPREHRPRLLYHRYFMVSESVFNLTAPFVEPAEVDLASDDQRQAYESAKQNAALLVRSIARDLIRRHAARRVRLFAQTHAIPPPWELKGPGNLREGLTLADPRLYEERLLGEFDGDGL